MNKEKTLQINLDNNISIEREISKHNLIIHESKEEAIKLSYEQGWQGKVLGLGAKYNNSWIPGTVKAAKKAGEPAIVRVPIMHKNGHLTWNRSLVVFLLSNSPSIKSHHATF